MSRTCTCSPTSEASLERAPGIRRVLLTLTGRGEATIGDERAPVEAGSLAVVPALVPHGVANTGDETLRIVGFFSSNTVLSVFDEPMEPFGTRFFRTPLIEEEVSASV